MYGQLKTVSETRAKKEKLPVSTSSRFTSPIGPIHIDISVVYIHEMTHFVMQYASKR